MALVNLYSDTQTRPTAAMRAAIAAAEVGDEQRGEDPTTRALEERVAALLGHEAAVFLPSGTMCNEIAIRLHIRPGGERTFIGRDTHTLIAEAGGPAQLSGAVITEVDGDSGMFTPEALEHAIHGSGPGGRYGPRERLVSVEQTTNMGGGRVWPLEQVRAVVEVAGSSGLATHLDGARLMNAVVASGVDAADWASGFDSAWLDFTKGLGAPVGACLAGSAAFIEEAWRWKQMLGGAMRRSGIVAAAGLYALDHHVERLADDHARALRLAEGLAALPGVELDAATVQTNIVIFAVPDAASFCAALAAADVSMSHFGPTRVRGVDPPRRRRGGDRPGTGGRRAGPGVACWDGDRLQHVPTVRGDLRASDHGRRRRGDGHPRRRRRRPQPRLRVPQGRLAARAPRGSRSPAHAAHPRARRRPAPRPGGTRPSPRSMAGCPPSRPSTATRRSRPTSATPTPTT